MRQATPSPFTLALIRFVWIAGAFRRRVVDVASADVPRSVHHIRVDVFEPRCGFENQTYMEKGRLRNSPNEDALFAWDQGLEVVMLLLFWMPLIVASAMLEPRPAKKPVKRQED